VAWRSNFAALGSALHTSHPSSVRESSRGALQEKKKRGMLRRVRRSSACSDAEGRALVRVCINAMDPTHPAQFIVLESQLENDC